MHAILFGDAHTIGTQRVPSSAASSKLDRAALLLGAATRKAQAEAMETDMAEACEAAAFGSRATLGPLHRRFWDQAACDRYVAEAVRQARTHAATIHRLRREAEQLERLLRMP